MKIFTVSSSASKPCHLKAFKTGLVCFCNETYCDTLEFDLPKVKGEALIISTSESGLRYHESRGQFQNEERLIIPHGPYYYESHEHGDSNEYMKIVEKFTHFDEPLNRIVNIHVEKDKEFQKIVGFGGALTGSVSYNLKKLESDKLRNFVYRGYYSKKYGNGFNMMRYTIGGCDFDFEPWAYQESPEHDPYLANFTKLDDRDYEKIEQIKVLQKIADNHDIKFIGAAWGPPKWMKTNGEWTGFGFLREEYYQTWADYHVKFLELMHEANISFYAISSGNEPQNGVVLPFAVHFISLGWLPRDQARWLVDHLGPSIKKSQHVSQVKILSHDDARITLPYWLEQMMEAAPEVDALIEGLAFHWYSDRVLGGMALDRVYAKHPNKIFLSTEACAGWSPIEVRRPLLGYWPRAESYILDIMEDFNHHTAGWIDWNLVLDEDGGPNYAENYVDAPIIVNKTEIYKQPMFYALGHFSRFILAESVRIGGKSSHKSVKSLAFLRPDGYTTVVLYNT